MRRLIKRFEPLALLAGTAAVAVTGLGMAGASIPAQAATSGHSAVAAVAHTGLRGVTQDDSTQISHPAKNYGFIHGMKVIGPDNRKRVNAGEWCLRNTGSFHICLNSQGAGHQIQTEQDGGSVWTQVDSRAIAGGFTAFAFVNGNNNCLREGTGNVVKLQNGFCTFDDDNYFIFEDNGRKVNLNYAPDTMYVTNDTDLLNVWSGTVTAGDGKWANWMMPTSF
jgi:hypothetical protein